VAPRSSEDWDAPEEFTHVTQADPRKLTSRERRRRVIVLSLLLLLLLLLGWMAYHYTVNRRLPSFGITPPGSSNAIAPPEYLYSISGNGASEIRRPVGVGVADDGRVYVVDFGNRRVSVFTNAGRYLFSFNKTAEGNLVSPVHLVVKGREVWVSDRRYRTIFIFDLEGKYLRKFEPTNEKLEWTPLAFSFDASGGLKATDVQYTNKHRLMYFSPEGSRTVTLGKTAQVKVLQDSPGTFLFPNGVAIAPNGDVYVSDGDNRRVQVFDPSGAFVRFVDSSGVPRGIAIDSQKRVYVVDALAHTIGVYDLKGQSLTRFGSRGYGPGQFNYPNDVTLDKRGRIYISDRENDQVQVWGWPVLITPGLAAPSSPWGWLAAAACCFPLLLLPFLMWSRRKIRIVVTPEFVYSLEQLEEIGAVSERTRLRLVAPEEDREMYAGRVAQGIDLTELITFEEHSESDVRALRERYGMDERPAILLALTARAKALGTVDRELRLLAMLAELRVVDPQEFREAYLGRERSTSAQNDEK
jgi:DNA-binding beta-propeller fold protein YncE/predicted nucleic acid-binding protein